MVIKNFVYTSYIHNYNFDKIITTSNIRAKGKLEYVNSYLFFVISFPSYSFYISANVG